MINIYVIFLLKITSETEFWYLTILLMEYKILYYNIEQKFVVTNRLVKFLSHHRLQYVTSNLALPLSITRLEMVMTSDIYDVLTKSICDSPII